MSSQAPEEQHSRAERIEELLRQVGELPDPRIRAQVEELLQSLLDLFGDGLARMLELTEQSPAGETLLAAFCGDDLIGSLLLLYGLHPDDLETRVARAVEEVRGTVEKHGGRVELAGVREGVAYVRLNSAGCAGCSSSAAALQPLIEQAIYAAAPDLEIVRIEDAARPQQLITLTPARRKGAEARPALRGGERS